MLTPRRDESGFTIIELLISITILGVLMAAVTGAMLVALDTNAATGTRIDESRDQQFAAAYFSGDVQSAKTITLGAAGGAPNLAAKCGTTPAVLVVDLVGQDFDVSTHALITTVVSYVRIRGADGVTDELHRRVCTATTAAPSFPLPVPDGMDTIVARNLSPAWSAGCLAAGCTGIVVTLRSGGLEYTLVGYRRTS